MKEFVNFYENLPEAHLRLLNNVVLYDGEPYFIHAITDHKKDGIFRVYMELQNGDTVGVNRSDEYCPAREYGSDYSDLGVLMDGWMERHPEVGLIRKQMNSPLFKKFKPFPLGMSNFEGEVFYLERRPMRRGDQGITQDSIINKRLDAGYHLSLGDSASMKSSLSSLGNHRVPFTSDAFYDTCLGNYPSAEECLTNLLDGNCENSGAAFSRDFAIMRGPFDMLFLAYKTSIVGLIPFGDFSTLKLSRYFPHLREVILENTPFREVKEQ